MKLYLELLVFFILMLMFIFWKWWYWWTTKRLFKKYNPEKDLARLGEEKNKSGNHNGKKIKGDITSEAIRRTSEVEGRESESPNTTSSIIGLGLQTAKANPRGEESKSFRMSLPIREDKKRPTRSRRSRRRFG